ncbi:phosphoribosyl-ATP diphosphatase [Bosea thiooxidans]|nr:phosphoribosyl-ATP diphosphatase [Bosea sp. (in: a-proteobacteria)]
MTDSVRRLHAAIKQARTADPARSRTAKLFGGGMPRIAKKVAEEAVEVGIAALQGQRREAILESADLIYNLAALWTAMGIEPEEIWDELDRREQLYGIAEKLPKTRSPDRLKAQQRMKLTIGSSAG